MNKVNKILIKDAAAVVSCDADDTVYRDVDILIEGSRILGIGKGLSADGAEQLSAEGRFIYPGLVNTHHHFFQTFVRNLTAVDFPNMSVIQWLDEIYEIFKLISSEAIYYSSLTAMADLIKHGCTCAFDHQYCYPRSAGKELVDRQMEAASLLGMRYHAGRGVNTLPRSEGSTIPDEMLETTDEFLSDCDRLIDLYHDDKPFSMSQIVVAPCQPVNSYRDTFVESAALARDKGVRLHSHLGEGENAPMEERWGMRSLDWCEEIGFAGPDVWYAHGWEFSAGELERMARRGTGLSHCPAPAVLGGFPILDIPAIDRMGLSLSLGCDGSATNDGSNLLDSLRMAYLMQCFHSKERGGSPSPYRMLKAATVGGADHLGRPDLGSLEPGKAADLFMIDTEVLELAGAVHDPANLLPRVAVTGPVALTMINGKVVWENGELTGVDERALFHAAEAACDDSIRDKVEHFTKPGFPE
ncbi:MAG: amidohydrolase [Spirochaetes bacterium]|nr:MAG: amidohydrolase [Spirochaetota bacterium]